MNNEKKELSHNRKRRIEQRIKVDDKINFFFEKISLKKMKNKNDDKIKQLEIELVKLKYVYNLNKLQSELKDLYKIHVIDKKLRENKNEILRD